MSDNHTERLEITLKDVFIAQQDTTKALTLAINEINLNLKDLSGSINGWDDRLKSVSTTQDDHESRIRGLERWRYALPTSMFLSIVSIAGMLTELFAILLKK